MTEQEKAYFDKMDLIPAIIQDTNTKTVLMLGYMNQEALTKTLELGKVTFFSRSKQRLWTKGESSGHYLQYRDHSWDCDKDALLIMANPIGPTCHTGTDTCWGKENRSTLGFLDELEGIINQRIEAGNSDSYVLRMYEKGLDKLSQKVGEEAVEVVIASKNSDDEELIDESADLLFHLLMLLNKRSLSIQDIAGRLAKRHVQKKEAD